MTLALLITAVTGAWAQTQWESGDCTVTLNNGTLTVSGNGTMADYLNDSDRPWYGNRNDITSVVVESGVTSVGFNAFYFFSNLTSVTLPEGLTAIGPNAFDSCISLQSITIPSTVTSIGNGAFSSCSAMTSVTLPEGLTAIGVMAFYDCSSLTSVTLPEGLTTISGGAFWSCSSLTSVTIPSTVTSIADYAFSSCSAMSDINLYANPDNLTWGDTSMDFKSDKATQCHVLAEHLSTYQNNFSSANVTFVGDLQPLATSKPVEVTTNAAEEGATFTEASFQMPAFDATADYELVRDMSIQMTATMGDGTDGVRYRVKKAQQGEGYEPADLNMMQVLALVAVNDGIEQKALTQDQDYFCRIYKLDEQTLQPEGDGVMLYDFDFAPGLYALKAFAQDDSDYAGETALSNTFKLFQGYEVEVAAKEFITYYKDEPLYVEDEAAELYTIESVNGDQAVLSDRSDAMPSNTPMLVYNKSNETKVILLIPCAEPDMAVTVAPEFQGTLNGTTIAASTEGQTNYAFNGKAFVFVKNAIEVGPNKAWLSVNTGEPSARITLVFDDETTKITNTNLTNITNGNWYDLNGRKLDKMPTKKGVYIFNGKKVVVK